MDTKKDPGKFTIRFCMSDPRQKRAVEELNAQGRLKAQFLANAILHYVEGSAAIPPQEELEPILERLMKRMLDERANTDVKSAEKIAPPANRSAPTTLLPLQVPCRRFAESKNAADFRSAAFFYSLSKFTCWYQIYVHFKRSFAELFSDISCQVMR